MPHFAIEPPIGEEGQHVTRVGLNDGEVVEVTPNVPPFVLSKRNHDNGVGVSYHKKSRAFLSL